MRSIKTGLPPASLPFKGQVIERKTVKWSVSTVHFLLISFADVSVIWAGGRTSPPSDKPRCGWDKELCLEEEEEGKIVASTPNETKFSSCHTLLTILRQTVAENREHISYVAMATNLDAKYTSFCLHVEPI